MGNICSYSEDYLLIIRGGLLNIENVKSFNKRKWPISHNPLDYCVEFCRHVNTEGMITTFDLLVKNGYYTGEKDVNEIFTRLCTENIPNRHKLIYSLISNEKTAYLLSYSDIHKMISTIIDHCESDNVLDVLDVLLKHDRINIIHCQYNDILEDWMERTSYIIKLLSMWKNIIKPPGMNYFIELSEYSIQKINRIKKILDLVLNIYKYDMNIYDIDTILNYLVYNNIECQIKFLKNKLNINDVYRLHPYDMNCDIYVNPLIYTIYHKKLNKFNMLLKLGAHAYLYRTMHMMLRTDTIYFIECLKDNGYNFNDVITDISNEDFNMIINYECLNIGRTKTSPMKPMKPIIWILIAHNKQIPDYINKCKIMLEAGMDPNNLYDDKLPIMLTEDSKLFKLLFQNTKRSIKDKHNNNIAHYAFRNFKNNMPLLQWFIKNIHHALLYKYNDDGLTPIQYLKDQKIYKKLRKLITPLEQLNIREPTEIKLQIYDSDECCICLEKFSNKLYKYKHNQKKHQKIYLNCRHTVHWECYNEYRKTQVRCPVCRQV